MLGSSVSSVAGPFLPRGLEKELHTSSGKMTTLYFPGEFSDSVVLVNARSRLDAGEFPSGTAAVRLCFGGNIATIDRDRLQLMITNRLAIARSPDDLIGYLAYPTRYTGRIIVNEEVPTEAAQTYFDAAQVAQPQEQFILWARHAYRANLLQGGSPLDNATGWGVRLVEPYIFSDSQWDQLTSPIKYVGDPSDPATIDHVDIMKGVTYTMFPTEGYSDEGAYAGGCQPTLDYDTPIFVSVSETSARTEDRANSLATGDIIRSYSRSDPTISPRNLRVQRTHAAYFLYVTKTE